VFLRFFINDDKNYFELTEREETLGEIPGFEELLFFSQDSVFPMSKSKRLV